jgi:hypothetical protein
MNSIEWLKLVNWGSRLFELEVLDNLNEGLFALGLSFPIHFHKGPPESPAQESVFPYLISLSLTLFASLTRRNFGQNGHFRLAFGFLRLPL